MPERYQLGLIGYPVGHSLSPRLHRAALEACRLHGEYQLYEVLPFPQGEVTVRRLLEKLLSGEIHGLNVTTPHKQSVIPLLDTLTPTARAIGAVNTIYLDTDRLVGENTDAAGFLADLRDHLSRLGDHAQPGTTEGGSALVLGAGGSARAVVYALLQDGWDVCVAARREEQANEMVSALRGDAEDKSRLSAVNLRAASLERILAGGKVRLVVQTTPMGMSPNLEGCAWPEGLPLPTQALIYDLVYNPTVTRLVKSAREAGLAAANGSGMLIEQAARAFALWTGCEPPRQAMWQALETQHQEKLSKPS